MDTSSKYHIVGGDRVNGYLKHVATAKGGRWVLSMVDNDRVFFFRSFDQAYSSMFKKKPATSMIVRVS